jgi:hypothetical protein
MGVAAEAIVSSDDCWHLYAAAYGHRGRAALVRLKGSLRRGGRFAPDASASSIASVWLLLSDSGSLAREGEMTA